MTQLISPDRDRTIGQRFSPATWLKVAWGGWINPKWYWARIHPRLIKEADIKVHVAQAISGTVLSALISWLLVWVAIQITKSIVPIDDSRLYVNVILGALFILVIGPFGLFYSRSQARIPISTLGFGWSLTFTFATLGSLATLVTVQLVAPQSLASRLSYWPPTVGIEGGGMLAGVILMGFIPVAMRDEKELGSWMRLRKLQRPIWIMLFAILWLMFVTLQGSLAAVRELHYDPTIGTLMSWVVPLIGCVWGYLLGVALAWRFLDART